MALPTLSTGANAPGIYLSLTEDSGGMAAASHELESFLRPPGRSRRHDRARPKRGISACDRLGKGRSPARRTDAGGVAHGFGRRR